MVITIILASLAVWSCGIISFFAGKKLSKASIDTLSTLVHRPKRIFYSNLGTVLVTLAAIISFIGLWFAMMPPSEQALEIWQYVLIVALIVGGAAIFKLWPDSFDNANHAYLVGWAMITIGAGLMMWQLALPLGAYTFYRAALLVIRAYFKK